MRKTLLLTVTLCAGVTLWAQGNKKYFEYGKWMEIQADVMQDVAKYYADTVPVGEMYRAGIDKMLSMLDPYTVYIPESEQEDFEMMVTNTYGGIGAIINKEDADGYVTINEPYADTPAAKAGLRCGDELLRISGKDSRSLTTSEASSLLRGKAGTSVTVLVKKVRTGEEAELQIIRERITLPTVEYWGMRDNATGYILLSGFIDGTSKEVREAFDDLKAKGMKRLVLDLRGNGGGLLEEAVKIVSLFVPKGTLVVSSKGTDGDIPHYTESEPVDKEIPLLILVNSTSASASEIVAGAIQDLDRGTVAGTRSFGKGLVQRVLPVRYNGQVKVTVAKYYTPSGRCVQAKDYSHRSPDGSVGDIPDSLTHEFKTSKGRIVRDGGGISPDITVENEKLSRTAYGVYMAGLCDRWPIEYCRLHDSIAAVDEFALSDEEYGNFIKWALTKEFDCRSESAVDYECLVESMKKDGTFDAAREQLDILKSLVKVDKESALLSVKSELKPMLEKEIIARYYFKGASLGYFLKYDKQLEQAVSKWTAK